MARNNKKRRRSQPVRLTRPTLALDHTVSRPRRSFTFYTGPGRGLFPSTVRSSLIRTVRVDSLPAPPPRRSTPNSPLVAVRATGRSSDLRIRSPFLTAQGITPQLANRAIVCAGRNIRREVLFARKLTGKGSRSPRRDRSKVRC